MKLRNGFLMVIPFVVISAVSAAFDLDFPGQDPVYISPTRLLQSPHDTPASVSRIDQETIDLLQADTIPELLRHVAGMIVSDKAGNNSQVNYHGTNGLSPRRMQVLVNGVSVYRPSYAEIVWQSLPVTVHDIDFIEVIRSPSAATYGANASMAAINIVTKKALHSTSGVKLTVGEQGKANADLVFAGEVAENLLYRLSFIHQEDQGYDKNTAGEERHDDLNANKFNGRFEYSAADDLKGNIFIGYSDVLTELEFRDRGQLSFPDLTTESYYGMSETIWSINEKHDIAFKAYAIHTTQEREWRSCYPTIFFSENLRALNSANPAYSMTLLAGGIPSGGSQSDDALRDAVIADFFLLGASALSSVCGDVNENAEDRKYDFEIQDTYLVNDNFRLVSGLGALYQRHNSETFLNRSISNYAYRLFANAEYRWQRWVINVGGMLEEEENYLDQPSLSPRLGLNYRLSDTSTLRFVFSKSIRTPDILEQDMNWSYHARNLDPAYPLDGRTESDFYINARTFEEIDPEQVIAREVSVYSFSKHPWSNGYITPGIDIKYFHNSLYDLVSEKLQYLDYNPSNDGSVTLQGFEIDANVKFDHIWFPDILERMDLHFNYAYIDSDTDEFYEKSLHATHSGAFYSIAHLAAYWHLSFAYAGNSSILGEAFDEFQLGLGKRFRFSSGELSLKGKLTYLPDLKGGFVIEGGAGSALNKISNINDSHTYAQLTLSYSFY